MYIMFQQPCRQELKHMILLLSGWSLTQSRYKNMDLGLYHHATIIIAKI